MLKTIIAIGSLIILLTMEDSLASGSRKYSISIDSHIRTYLVYRPSYLKPEEKTPLVIMLHGGFGTGAQAENGYGWDTQADAHGFVVVYPDGTNHSWNAGGTCCGKAVKNNIDDIEFITGIIKQVSKDENINPKRVYLAGISNGAALSYRYACEGSYPVAAIGSVSGSFSYECPKPHPVSVMEIHGMDDHNIPFGGGQGTKGVARVNWLPVERTLAVFHQADRCGVPMEQKDGAVKTVFSKCSGNREVILVTIDGAGHQWPGGKKHGLLARALLPVDPPSQVLDATDVLWKFFQSHPAE